MNDEHISSNGRLSSVIRASEIGQYTYCPRAWWLQNIVGVNSVNAAELQHGEETHEQHGQSVWWSGALRWVALGLIMLAIAVVLLSV
jgi:CRISPR/Cas system-associated exonuclease Cas4 (RecB family)